jgi:hypothetical protein
MARFRDLQSLFRMHAASAGPCALKCPAKNAPVAQLDRAPDYESGGQEFESLRARHSVLICEPGNQAIPAGQDRLFGDISCRP